MLQSLAGLIIFTTIAWLLSEQRQAVSPRIIIGGLLMQLLLGLLLLKLPLSRLLFVELNDMILAIDAATEAGTAFVFGYLGGGPSPFDITAPGSSFILAFRALPLILVVSALSALLFYWRVLPRVVQAFAWALQRTLGISGTVGLGAAANIFVGMVESPLLIRPYLAQMNRSELFAVMSCGMATIAGTVLVLYANILADTIPDAMGHILSASLISAPAALMVAYIMIPASPPTDSTDASERAAMPTLPVTDHSSMDAVTRGALDGMKLFLNIIAMLIVLVSLVHLANQLLGLLPLVADQPLTLQRILGWLMAPIVWLMGIPWSEATLAGGLMGVKTILNELLAYLQLAALPEEGLSPRSRLIMTYALCGFANLGSLGIMLGGLSALVPERRQEIVAMGMRLSLIHI